MGLREWVQTRDTAQYLSQRTDPPNPENDLALDTNSAETDKYCVNYLGEKKRFRSLAHVHIRIKIPMS